jgi:acetyltransferase-like isoleucine patch superfamily enzyme
MKRRSDKQIAPVCYRVGFRSWLWPLCLLRKHTAPVPPGLYRVNAFFQRFLGVNAEVPWNVHFTSRVIGDFKIGRNVWVSFAVSGGCYIQGGNAIEIGDDTIFALGVKIISANHDPDDLSRWKPAQPVRIGKHCWIGANAVILPAVELGDNVVVGAAAVVTRSFNSGSVIAGTPAMTVEAMTTTTRT